MIFRARFIAPNDRETIDRSQVFHHHLPVHALDGTLKRLTVVIKWDLEKRFDFRNNNFDVNKTQIYEIWTFWFRDEKFILDNSMYTFPSKISIYLFGLHNWLEKMANLHYFLRY